MSPAPAHSGYRSMLSRIVTALIGRAIAQLLVGQASRSQPRLPAPESSELRGSGRQITLARVYLCLFPGASGSRRKRTLAALCFCVFLCWAAPNALADYRFDNWTTDNGLPNNSVHDIVQTRRLLVVCDSRWPGAVRRSEIHCLRQ